MKIKIRRLNELRSSVRLRKNRCLRSLRIIDRKLSTSSKMVLIDGIVSRFLPLLLRILPNDGAIYSVVVSAVLLTYRWIDFNRHGYQFIIIGRGVLFISSWPCPGQTMGRFGHCFRCCQNNKNPFFWFGKSIEQSHRKRQKCIVHKSHAILDCIGKMKAKAEQFTGTTTLSFIICNCHLLFVAIILKQKILRTTKKLEGSLWGTECKIFHWNWRHRAFK